MDKRKVPWKGQLVDGQPLEFRTAGEEWNVYWLSDGTEVKVKVVVMDVVKVEGAYDGEGNPVYTVKHHVLFQVNAPANLRKLPEQEGA